ncbi:hypothetical protein R9Q05_00815, partial [Escherichia coli]
KRVFLVILFTSFSGSLVSRIPGAVQYVRQGDGAAINSIYKAENFLTMKNYSTRLSEALK